MDSGFMVEGFGRGYDLGYVWVGTDYGRERWMKRLIVGLNGGGDEGTSCIWLESEVEG